MAQVSIPYQQIAAPTNGLVQNGFVYIGVAGTMPDPDRASTWATVYANGTIASQPIRTNANGVMVDGSGSPKIYTVDAAAFSLLVQDANRTTLYRAATVQQITDGSVGTDALADNAVTYEKIQPVTRNRILGRIPTVDGNVSELTIASEMEITPGGTFGIKDGGINALKIQDGEITNAKIASGAVTNAKIADDSVTYAKMQNASADRLLGRRSGSSGDIEEITHSSDFTITAGGELQLSSVSFASLGSSGYARLPGGLLVQWGQASASQASSSSVVFPTVFATAVYRVVFGMRLSSAADPMSGVGYGSATTSGFTFYNTNSIYSATADYIAIGS